ncbi:MAG: primosomal protein N' family DNA-binding protein, partial [Acidiferrobacter sp.]
MRAIFGIGRRDIIVAIRISLPVPLRRTFDYEHPVVLMPGVRVRVPFGRRTLTGLVVAAPVEPPPGLVLRPISEVIDHIPLMSHEQLELLRFVADYYHHPLGEVLFGALPSALKRGGALPQPKAYRLTSKGEVWDERAFGRALRQRALWLAIKEA